MKKEWKACYFLCLSWQEKTKMVFNFHHHHFFFPFPLLRLWDRSYLAPLFIPMKPINKKDKPFVQWTKSHLSKKRRWSCMKIQTNSISTSSLNLSQSQSSILLWNRRLPVKATEIMYLTHVSSTWEWNTKLGNVVVMSLPRKSQKSDVRSQNLMTKYYMAEILNHIFCTSCSWRNQLKLAKMCVEDGKVNLHTHFCGVPIGFLHNKECS